MATAKDLRATPERTTGSLGLLANGSSGKWEIAIDATTSGADRWFVLIDGPVVSFYVEIPSVDIVGKMLYLLERRHPVAAKASTTGSGGNQSLLISKEKKNPVRLVQDDEYTDRFFLVVGSINRPLVRFALAGLDVASFSDALRQVQEDLKGDN